MNLRTVFLIFLLFSSSSHADNTKEIQVNNSTLLVLGDSLSAAYGIELEQGWVNLLQERLSYYSQNTEWNVVNASVSGETTAGGLARLPDLLGEYKPTICIIALGANDGLRGQSLNNMKNNVAAMIEACENYGDVLLIGMQLPPNYGLQYAAAFHQSYLDLAESHEIEIVPFMLEKFALDNNYFQTDQLHPTAEAQPLILETIWPVLDKLLQR